MLRHAKLCHPYLQTVRATGLAFLLLLPFTSIQAMVVPCYSEEIWSHATNRHFITSDMLHGCYLDRCTRAVVGPQATSSRDGGGITSVC